MGKRIKSCLKCGNNIPIRVKLNGKLHNLCNRKYCLECSPFRSGNTKKLHIYTENSDKKSRYHRLSEEARLNFNQESYAAQKKTRFKKKKERVNSCGGQCNICGYSRNLSALHFHHLNPSDKLFDLSYRCTMGWSEEQIRDEMAKCLLLCANCHSELHHPELNNWNA